MVPEHVRLHPPKGRHYRIDLVADVDAVALVADHLLKTPNLTLDAAQPGQLPLVRHLDAAVHFVWFRHLHEGLAWRAIQIIRFAEELRGLGPIV